MNDITYKAMIYFVCSTLWFYRKSIDHGCDSVSEFREKNAAAVKRVFDEGLSMMGYELSWNQVDTGIAAYISGHTMPQSVDDTEAYAA